jgi:hypothetical protein
VIDQLEMNREIKGVDGQTSSSSLRTGSRVCYPPALTGREP